MDKADSYEYMPCDTEILTYQPDVYHRVWEQAGRLRGSRELLQLGERIQCPVVAIHGDYDPHPTEGIKTPLSCTLKDFRPIPLECCGHHPRLERTTGNRFYNILKGEVT